MDKAKLTSQKTGKKKLIHPENPPADPVEDARVLDYAFRDVTPLAGRKIEPQPIRLAKEVGTVKSLSRRASTSSPVAPSSKPVTLPLLSPGDSPGLNKRTAQRLKRGRVEIEGRIDLHGMTQDRAHNALRDFLATSQSLGRRCVLVITGKGLNPQTGVGILKAATPRWLNETPNRERILSFVEAQPQHGGGGALYIYLRRPK